MFMLCLHVVLCGAMSGGVRVAQQGLTMSRKLSSDPEFRIEADGVLHVPTGHKFLPHAGMEDLSIVQSGNLFVGSDTYVEDDLMAKAVRLWANRKKLRSGSS